MIEVVVLPRPPSEVPYHLRTGEAVESAVALYLQNQGLRVLHRNFRCKQGEVDLIALDGDQLLFVEVRFRNKDNYGTAQESITSAKKRKIIQSARFFLYRYPNYANHACRFDVVGVTLKNQQLHFDWIQHAFY